MMFFFLFVCNYTATTENYTYCHTLSLHDALPIWPAAMIVGSFTSVSLDPALVAFFPDKASSSWPRIAEAERFCVNVLGDDQEALCRTLASKEDRKSTRLNSSH